MRGKRLFFGLFLCVAFVQIAVPVSMIVRREMTLRSGRQLKFRTAPVDPYDAFRGRYVALRIEAQEVPVPPDLKLVRGQKVYALVEEDDEGFSRFSTVTVRRPKAGAYIGARVRSIHGKDLRLRLPFDRYYMEESAAPEAEAAYRAHSRQGSRDAYVTVRVRRGIAMLEELYVGGKPIREFLKEPSPD